MHLHIYKYQRYKNKQTSKIFKSWYYTTKVPTILYIVFHSVQMRKQWNVVEKKNKLKFNRKHKQNQIRQKKRNETKQKTKKN